MALTGGRPDRVLHVPVPWRSCPDHFPGRSSFRWTCNKHGRYKVRDPGILSSITNSTRRTTMIRSIFPLVACLAIVSPAQAVDYQKLYDSVDKQKAAESVDQQKMGEAVGTDGVDYQKAYEAVDKEKAAESVDLDTARDALGN